KQADSQDGRKAFKDDRFHKGDRRTSLVHDSKESTNSFGERSSRSMKKKRMLVVGLVVLVMGMISPFGWRYLHSYDATDGRQIDGHMGPVSCRIDGTIIAVHVEDEDRVTKGALLVEIDPRDYQVAVEQARARLALARAQVASAEQNYVAALAKVRED